MALTGKTVSLPFLIERIQDTYGFLRGVDPYSVAEHVYDAIALVGVPMAYTRKMTDGIGDHPDIVTIENHRGELPCDLFQVISCKEQENGYPMIEDTSTFRQSWDDTTTSDDVTHPITYNVNGKYIYTKFKDGYIIVDYMAFPTDAEGMPVIPDNVRYIKAVMAYVAERVGFRLWMEDNLSDKKYRHLEQEWMFYVKSAKTAALTPNLDKLESFKNQMARMMNNEHHHSLQFKYRQHSEALKVK